MSEEEMEYSFGYPDGIEVDVSGLTFAAYRTMEFDEDGTATMGFDAARTSDCLDKLLEDYRDALLEAVEAAMEDYDLKEADFEEEYGASVDEYLIIDGDAFEYELDGEEVMVLERD